MGDGFFDSASEGGRPGPIDSSLVGSDLATLNWFEAGTGKRYPVTCGQQDESIVSLGFEGMFFRR